MADQRIQYTEELVGAGHPTKADTLNRLVLVEHNPDGTHGNLNITGGLTLSGGVWPSFAAYKNADQSVSASTFAKVTFDVEEWDTNNDYDLTNSWFKPTVAGKYLICSGLRLGGLSTNRIIYVSVFKNGVEWKRTAGYSDPNSIAPNIATTVDMNGSTDYVDIRVYIYGESGTVRGWGSQTWVHGVRIA